MDDWRRGHQADARCAAGGGGSTGAAAAVPEISVACEAMAVMLGVKVPDVLLGACANFQVHFHHVSAFHQMRKRLPMLHRIVRASAGITAEN